MSRTTNGPPGRLRRLVPIVDWLPRYDRRWLRGDIAAGIAVTALIVPKNLGYAGIAGVPLQNGLYAAAAGALIYALFCTSRQISTGPSSSLAAVAGGAVLADRSRRRARRRSSSRRSRSSPACCSCCSRCFKLGWIAQFLSKAVVTGFLAGAAVDVVDRRAAEADRNLVRRRQRLAELGSWVRALGDIHWATLLVGVVALAVILGAAVRRARDPRRARARRRRPARVGPLRPRCARRGARRRRAARAAGAACSPTSTSSGRTSR